MKETKLAAAEARFADMIWSKEPISTAELVKLCETELNWKRTTTYTVLKRLSDKGIFRNNNGEVSSLISKEDFYSAGSVKYIEESFGGSLPAFIAAFTKKKALTAEEIDEIRRMIEEFER